MGRWRQWRLQLLLRLRKATSKDLAASLLAKSLPRCARGGCSRSRCKGSWVSRHGRVSAKRTHHLQTVGEEYLMLIYLCELLLVVW